MSQPSRSSMQPIILEEESGWCVGLAGIALGTLLLLAMAKSGFNWGVLCIMLLSFLIGVGIIVAAPKRSPGIRIDENGIHYLTPDAKRSAGFVLIDENGLHSLTRENSRTPPARDIRWEHVAEVRLEKRYGHHGSAKYMHWFKVIVLTMKDGAVQEVDLSALSYYGREPLAEALKRMHSASSNRPESS
jgi:hypothetical protein